MVDIVKISITITPTNIHHAFNDFAMNGCNAKRAVINTCDLN